MAAHIEGIAVVRWRLVPLHAPTVLRHCRRCNQRRGFSSSGKFRLNRQKKRLDAWLIYKCQVCDQTWKCTLFSQLGRDQIDPGLHRRLAENDPATALRYACDRQLLKRNKVEWDAKVEYRVEGPLPRLQGKVVIRLDFAVPFPVRLDGLLARELQLSRSRLRQLRRDGGLTLDGAPAPKQLDRAGALIMDFTRPPCCFAR